MSPAASIPCPFVDNAFDAAMMVRVMHHVEDVPSLLNQVARILSGSGTLRAGVCQQAEPEGHPPLRRSPPVVEPLRSHPHEFAEMNFDFHPAWMQERLTEAGFHVKRRLTVSHFRLPLLKRLATSPRACDCGSLLPTHRQVVATHSQRLRPMHPAQASARSRGRPIVPLPHLPQYRLAPLP